MSSARRIGAARKAVWFVLCVCLTQTDIVTVRGVSDTVVISQVYGGGGNSLAPFQNKFVELFNRGTTAVSLNGWSLQYRECNGDRLFLGEQPVLIPRERIHCSRPALPRPGWADRHVRRHRYLRAATNSRCDRHISKPRGGRRQVDSSEDDHRSQLQRQPGPAIRGGADSPESSTSWATATPTFSKVRPPCRLCRIRWRASEIAAAASTPTTMAPTSQPPHRIHAIRQRHSVRA